ncbi:MAG TPA: radical SAM protein [Thermodesulfovibrionales bacterium]|nr:radical SAM protein [Thermodesulfovibrionales bacterium]
MSINNAADFFVQWHLTERCNLSCKHCYQTSGKITELSLAEIKNVLGEISDMLLAWSETYGITFSPSLNITGGEPFLHDDIFEILEDMRKRSFNIYLLSNGILINAEIAKLLSWLGVRGVQVSIEGPEKIHESIRGNGTFSAALKGVRHLLDSGVNVTLNVTLSEINANHFLEIVKLASSLGVQKLGFSRLVPSGRGAVLLDKMLKKEAVEDIYREIFSLYIKGLELVTGDPVASQMSDRGEKDTGVVPTGGCAAGVSGLTLLPDGTVAPCRRLPIAIGNVRRDSLREIWATSKVLESLRDKSQYGGKCRTCNRWAKCRGCRAIAYAYSRSKGGGDFLSEDPQCFII